MNNIKNPLYIAEFNKKCIFCVCVLNHFTSYVVNFPNDIIKLICLMMSFDIKFIPGYDEHVFLINGVLYLCQPEKKIKLITSNVTNVFFCDHKLFIYKPNNILKIFDTTSKKYLSSTYLNKLNKFLKKHNSFQIENVVTFDERISIILTKSGKLILWNDISVYHEFEILPYSVKKIVRIADMVVATDVNKSYVLKPLGAYDVEPEFIDLSTFKIPIADVAYADITALRMVWNFTYSLVKIGDEFFLTNYNIVHESVILENIIQTNIDMFTFFLTKEGKLFRFRSRKGCVVCVIENVKNMYCAELYTIIVTLDNHIYKIKEKKPQLLKF